MGVLMNIKKKNTIKIRRIKSKLKSIMVKLQVPNDAPGGMDSVPPEFKTEPTVDEVD